METKTLDYETDRELEAARAAKALETERSVRPPKQFPRKILIFVALAAIIAVGVYMWVSSWDRQSTDDAQVDGHIAPVALKIAGNITEVLVNDNQQVKTGQVLVRIDPRDYQARVDQARAALAVATSQAVGASAGVPLTRETTSSGTSSAQAQVASAQADYAKAQVDYQRSASSEVAMARANADSAQANYVRAQADLNRMRPLADKQEISKLQFDGYIAAARMAESEWNAAKDKVSAAQQESETKKASVLAAQARVAQAEAGVRQAQATQGQVQVQAADAASASANVQVARANLNTAELNLSYTTLLAPMDGVITKKSAELGQMVQAGMGLMMIVPLNDVWVTANFKETQLRDVRVGQRAEVKVDLTGKTYPGHVDSISSATGTRMSLLPPENATGNYVKVVQRIPVKIVLDPIPGGNAILRPGMNAEATIFTK
jgi:membrane fusion protein, multidrug efflux system